MIPLWIFFQSSFRIKSNSRIVLFSKSVMLQYITSSPSRGHFEKKILNVSQKGRKYLFVLFVRTNREDAIRCALPADLRWSLAIGPCLKQNLVDFFLQLINMLYFPLEFWCYSISKFNCPKIDYLENLEDKYCRVNYWLLDSCYWRQL